ncbi:MAG: hypothetical protein KY438_08285, partial [Actinobacteria bacterium]|nr:hypothetical protein [Actinomycetota bacterium]
MPDTLPGANGPVQGQWVYAPRSRVDVGKLAGSVKDRRPAVVFSTLDSPRAVSLPAAASAD